MNHWIASDKHDSQLLSLKNRQTSSMSHHLYIIFSKCPPPVRIVLAENQWNILLWRRFETDAAFWHPCGIWKRVFRLSAGQCPITSCQRHSTAAGARDAMFIPLTLWPSNLPDLSPWTAACGVCFRSESIIPRSLMSTNWNDASRTSGQI